MHLDGRVIYQLDPAAFFDSDGGGVGDLEGVVRKLDHIRAAGLAFEQRSVFGVLHRGPDDAVLMLANLSPDEARVRLPYDVRADLLADSNYEPATRDLALRGYGYRWLRIHES